MLRKSQFPVYVLHGRLGSRAELLRVALGKRSNVVVPLGLQGGG